MPIEIGHQGDHGFDEPLGLLSDCHRRIKRFIGALRTVSQQAEGAPLSAEARAALELSSAYFRTAGPLHTEDEEQDLFPLLRAAAANGASEVAAVLATLESEHREHEHALAKVEPLVARWLALEDEGLPAGEARELRESLEALEQAYLAHLDVEDNQLFPAAAECLSASDFERLGSAMAERRGLPFAGPIARYLGADHERLHEHLAAAQAAPDRVNLEPFEHFRAGILRHIAMEEKQLIPRVTNAQAGTRPALADLLRTDHSAIAALLVPPPTPAILQTLSAILARHDQCEEQPGGLYDQCDRALGPQAALELVAELEQTPPVRLKPFHTSPTVQRHLTESVERSWSAWKRWSG